MLSTLAAGVVAAADPFNWTTGLSTGAITVAGAVAVTILVPWVTALFTKRFERLAAEHAERKEAATAVVTAAGKLVREWDEAKGAMQPGTKLSMHPTELNAACAKVLVLATSGRDEAAEYLQRAVGEAFRRDMSIELAQVLGDWAPRGRFNIKALPPQRRNT